MWKQRIGISIGNKYDIPITNVIKLLKETGFDAVSPAWENEEALSVVVSAAKENNLLIQSLHAPFGSSADLWSENEEANIKATNEILASLNSCVKFNIPVLVVHGWIGFDYKYVSGSLNFKSFDKIVSEAEKSNIKIAFENTEGEEYLFALMERYKNNETVGFCWDSGHEMCYNRSKDLLKEFGDRLIMTHLNDNLGISRFDGKIFWTDDLHLLPFDGIADWDYNIERLRKAKRLQILNFELNIASKPDRHENDIYGKMGLESYFAEAYKRACKIAYKYSK